MQESLYLMESSVLSICHIDKFTCSEQNVNFTPIHHIGSTEEDLVQLKLRISRFRLKQMRWECTIAYNPGENFHVSDTLSRALMGHKNGSGK